MSKRFTITTKWEDGWFWQLKPNEKLLWNYLCDKCDLAGFWEINLELAAVQTKIPKSAISGALQGLNRGYYTNGKHLWLRNFIHHQSNYPLNPKNNAHRHIISILERHTDFDVDFFEILETAILAPKQELISSPSKGNGNSKGNKKNTYIEFVKLTDGEHSKLVEKFGSEETKQKITALNDYIGSKGEKYRSHYHTILTWARKDAKNGGKTRNFPSESEIGETINADD